MRKDILMLVLGIFIGFTVANIYFVVSGNYPSSPFEEIIPYNFTTGSIAVILGLVISGALVVYLKKEIESLSLKNISRISTGFFFFGVLGFFRNAIYPAAIVCLILTCVFTYLGFLKK